MSFEVELEFNVFDRRCTVCTVCAVGQQIVVELAAAGFRSLHPLLKGINLICRATESFRDQIIMRQIEFLLKPLEGGLLSPAGPFA